MRHSPGTMASRVLKSTHNYTDRRLVNRMNQNQLPERIYIMDNITTNQYGTGASTAEADPSVRTKLHDKAQEAREQISARARETTTRVRSEGEHLLRDQKNRVADRIDHYGNAVHRAAQKLEDDQDAAIAVYAHRAAEQFERAAHYLRERDWRDLRRDAESFARRHQEVFLGGLFLGGLALARFLKASAHEEESTAQHYEPSTAYAQSPPPVGMHTPGQPGSI
jgi:NADH dehydrogenase/NADH:ubiquinone oxidoreductase subunit G